MRRQVAAGAQGNGGELGLTAMSPGSRVDAMNRRIVHLRRIRHGLSALLEFRKEEEEKKERNVAWKWAQRKWELRAPHPPPERFLLSFLCGAQPLEAEPGAWSLVQPARCQKALASGARPSARSLFPPAAGWWLQPWVRPTSLRVPLLCSLWARGAGREGLTVAQAVAGSSIHEFIHFFHSSDC